VELLTIVGWVTVVVEGVVDWDWEVGVSVEFGGGSGSWVRQWLIKFHSICWGGEDELGICFVGRLQWGWLLELGV